MRGQPNFSDDNDPTREQRPLADSQSFNAEEMQAIREQYEERIAAEVERREELEWQLRRALATIRDAELDARKASDQMNGIYSALAALLSPGEAAPAPAPARKAPPPLPPLPTKTTTSSVRRGPLPPRTLTTSRRLVA